MVKNKNIDHNALVSLVIDWVYSNIIKILYLTFLLITKRILVG